MAFGSDTTGATAIDGQLVAAGAQDDLENRHLAGLLACVERESNISQRQLAGQLGVALGLVNAYIKRCIKKGLIKVEQVPSRRYAYYLTPTGFAEKSRLTAEFLYWSLSFFRRARAECSELFAEAKRRGWNNMGLVGGGDLAEIALLCASEQDVKIVVIVDAATRDSEVLGAPVATTLEAAPARPDGWMVTGIQDAQVLHDALVAHAGAEHVLTPSILSVRTSGGQVLP